MVKHLHRIRELVSKRFKQLSSNLAQRNLSARTHASQPKPWRLIGSLIITLIFGVWHWSEAQQSWVRKNTPSWEIWKAALASKGLQPAPRSLSHLKNLPTLSPSLGALWISHDAKGAAAWVLGFDPEKGAELYTVETNPKAPPKTWDQMDNSWPSFESWFGKSISSFRPQIKPKRVLADPAELRY